MGFDTVRATVEREPSAPLTALSSSFDETPLAAATIAQVHRATTQDGRAMAVKVQRPGLDVTITTDMAALTYLVALGEKLFRRQRALDLPRVVREFDRSLRREIDFGREARASRNLERLARAITFAALVISGSLLLLTPMGGWHHRLGEAMVVIGIVGMLLAGIGALRRDHGPS